jgi:hypothetical protein
MAGLPPPHIAAHAARVQEWLDGEEAAERARANPQPTAAQRYDAIRTAQALAMSEGRVLPVPLAPVAVEIAIDPAAMSQAERWALMRATDQSTMKPWRDSRA